MAAVLNGEKLGRLDEITVGVLGSQGVHIYDGVGLLGSGHQMDDVEEDLL